MKIPLLDQEKKDIDSKELTIPQLEAEQLMKQLKLEHEQFRKDNWETLKGFRSRYDNEFHQSLNIWD